MKVQLESIVFMGAKLGENREEEGDGSHRATINQKDKL
jgi:hypothetical protein